ncbi:hypothetical protein EV385_1258 [Krasilnikovia cinnamomea]|uniref:Uncharacterized protein n=1 Tax=Krasilnikovia cinnamomea TaxID=349313 RepID=A0A4Q7ZH63_9ACTN|nr:hypothetical protein [Krasilnikovia cinnamomea]RZU49505.1 hypothetical protein EV385_1258 [Krasilnikovia cinnamomea]
MTIRTRRSWRSLSSDRVTYGCEWAGPPGGAEAETFVVHLTVTTYGWDAAADLARELCDRVEDEVRELDAGLTTVSYEGDPLRQRRVYCDKRLAGEAGMRCAMEDDHAGQCGEPW